MRLLTVIVNRLELWASGIYGTKIFMVPTDLIFAIPDFSTEKALRLSFELRLHQYLLALNSYQSGLL